MTAIIPGATDALEALLLQRHSCRGFKAEPVPRTTIERILTLAQHSASWCNSQPWQVMVTSGLATHRFREVMVTAAQETGPDPDYEFPIEYRGVYLERRRECGLALYDAVGIRRGDRQASAHQAMDNFRFFGAPHVAVVTSDRLQSTYGAVDCGAYISNFMLAATSLGVATIPQAALASRPKRVREFFGLSEDRLVVCGMSFGWADESHTANGFRTGRAEIEDVASWFE